ncbi:hypothetical protein [Bradyrhizobium sp. Ash2021]|uniref:hypothetical protein n=1 Tax=Bradyrhizobium sp. Ash2021 TaxID=2954771 RepID=UPI002815AA64|nr:hypothetical protein [Bradyrhizobium sp. Ash2021]WMT76057.1 hypothetical protein NL528_06635 [Bradyrhizobium sp. Ash2021]
MFNRRNLVTLIVGTGMLIVGTGMLVTAGFAQPKMQHHNDGHNLLGPELHQNGKHEVGKIGLNAVVAEVSNDKVVGMSVGDLPARKVKSNKKLASGDAGTVKIAANGPIRLAQVEVYYGYCFETGIDEYCYWYPATDVVVTDVWVPY